MRKYFHLVCCVVLCGQTLAQRASYPDNTFHSTEVLGSAEILAMLISNDRLLLARSTEMGAEIVRYTLNGQRDMSFKPFFIDLEPFSPLGAVQVYKLAVLSNGDVAIGTNEPKLRILSKEGILKRESPVPAAEIVELSNGDLYFSQPAIVSGSTTIRLWPKVPSAFESVVFAFTGEDEKIIVQKDDKPLFFKEMWTAIYQDKNYPLNNVARLMTDGTLDTTLKLGSYVKKLSAMEQMEDGTITGIGKLMLEGVEKYRYFLTFDKDMRLLDSLRLGGVVDSLVRKIVRGPDHSLYIESALAPSTNGFRLQKFDKQGKQDLTFYFEENSEWELKKMAIDANARPYLVTGKWGLVNGRDRIYRLDAKGKIDPTFNIYQQTEERSKAFVSTEGKIVYAGRFATPAGIRNLIRVLPNGEPDVDYKPDSLVDPFTPFSAITVLRDGSILASKVLSDGFGGEYAPLMRISADGKWDGTLSTKSFKGMVQTLYELPNNRIFAAGYLSAYAGVAVPSMAILDAQGNIDLDFLSRTTGYQSYYMASTQHANGDIYVVTNESPARILVLNPQGGIRSAFTLKTSLSQALVQEIHLNSAGEIVVAMNYKEGELTKQSLFVVESDGRLKATFTSQLVIDLTGWINYNLLIQPLEGGRILVHNPNNVLYASARKYYLLDAFGKIDTTFSLDYLGTNRATLLKRYDSKRVLIGYYKKGFNLAPNSYVVMRVYVEGDTPLDIQEMEHTMQGLLLYPNPATDYLQVAKWSGSDYHIYDLMGREVQYGTLKIDDAKLDIQQRQSGIYVVRFTQGGKSFTRSFVKN